MKAPMPGEYPRRPAITAKRNPRPSAKERGFPRTLPRNSSDSRLPGELYTARRRTRAGLAPDRLPLSPARQRSLSWKMCYRLQSTQTTTLDEVRAERTMRNPPRSCLPQPAGRSESNWGLLQDPFGEKNPATIAGIVMLAAMEKMRASSESKPRK